MKDLVTNTSTSANTHTHTHTHTLRSSYKLFHHLTRIRLSRGCRERLWWDEGQREVIRPSSPSGPLSKASLIGGPTHFIVPRDPTRPDKQINEAGHWCPDRLTPAGRTGGLLSQKHSLDPLRPSGQDCGSGTGFDKATRTRSSVGKPGRLKRGRTDRSAGLRSADNLLILLW